MLQQLLFQFVTFLIFPDTAQICTKVPKVLSQVSTRSLRFTVSCLPTTCRSVAGNCPETAATETKTKFSIVWTCMVYNRILTVESIKYFKIGLQQPKCSQYIQDVYIDIQSANKCPATLSKSCPAAARSASVVSPCWLDLVGVCWCHCLVWCGWP